MTLQKHYLNSQTISRIKYFCLRGVPGKALNLEVIEEGGQQSEKYNGTRRFDQALIKVVMSIFGFSPKS